MSHENEAVTVKSDAMLEEISRLAKEYRALPRAFDKFFFHMQDKIEYLCTKTKKPRQRASLNLLATTLVDFKLSIKRLHKEKIAILKNSDLDI